MLAGSSIIVMGVSGSGKTTIGSALASALGLRFVDADALHPAANRAKLAAGVPLTDDDRWPWLDAVGEVLASGSVVVACSALRRSYRDLLRAAAPGLRIVYLRGDEETLLLRVAGRRHEYMPPSLLDSQLATLEEPAPEERALALDIRARPEQIVADAVAALTADRDPESGRSAGRLS